MSVALRIRRKAYRTASGEIEVLGPLEIAVGDGEIVALVGPSGCGKTTLLRIIGGLDADFEGELTWSGGAPPRIGTVFQEPRLLPWRTVRQNLSLVRPPEVVASADELLAALGLSQFLDTYPPALSLGMARRAAIARAFSIAPELVLLDEPFVSLDAAMAERGREMLLRAWRTRPTAAVLVTHDRAEAASLADRLIVLSSRPTGILTELPVPPEQRRRGIATGALVIERMLAADPLGVGSEDGGESAATSASRDRQ